MTSQLPLQGTSLWLNFSTAQVQTGILNTDGSWAFFDTGAGETLQLLFAQVQQSLSVVSGGWQGLQHIVYSRGPGNLLGLRIGAMALQTWRSFPGVAALPYGPTVRSALTPGNWLPLMTDTVPLQLCAGSGAKWTCVLRSIPVNQVLNAFAAPMSLSAANLCIRCPCVRLTTVIPV
ncbi:MAG: hypothetical protein LR015_14820 [Verrucomicrobia bacterium]|nr:hypothetical protein [Verrucomicrobiota bacterium]